MATSYHYYVKVIKFLHFSFHPILHVHHSQYLKANIALVNGCVCTYELWGEGNTNYMYSYIVF